MNELPSPAPSSPSWVGLSTTQCHFKRIQRGIPTPDSWPYLEKKVRTLIARRVPAASLPPEVDLDDLVQVVLCHVLVNISQFAVTPEASFSGWVCWIARRRAVSMWREHRRGGLQRVALDDTEFAARLDQRAVDDAPSPPTIAHMRDLEARMRQAIEALSDKDQRVLSLREDGGLSFAEVAQVMRFEREVTARCRYHRAVQRRRKVMRAVYGG